MSSPQFESISASQSKILLFGRTGSGKSTVANMLIKGHLSPPFVFPTSSGIRGKTISFQRAENDDWVVVDTVGFGEGEHGSVVDAEARNKLYDFFVKITEERYNYYAYVHKWGKLDELDTLLWAFFKQAFQGVERNFVIIFTHCNPKALEENLEDIKVEFQGCERYITVDFPANDKPETAASAKTRRNEKMRVTSLKRLQESLEEFMSPSGTLCLRSNLKRGRILLMGTATRARNMVAKLLVDGAVNVTSTPGLNAPTMDIWIDGNENAESLFFVELEGRRWQVVNVLALDKESLDSVHQDVVTKDKAVAAASKAMTVLASKILTVMRHGEYSHFVYVDEWENNSEACKSVLREIVAAKRWREYMRCVAVMVNYDGKVPSKVPNRFKGWGTTCHIQLPSICDSPDTGTQSEKQVVLQRAVDDLEEVLLLISPRSSQWHSCETAGSIDPIAFKGLVSICEEFHGMSTLQKLKASNLSPEKVKFGNNIFKVRTIVCRLPIKHIAAEISCYTREKWHRVLGIYVRGENASLRQRLRNEFIWGELQAVDENHVDRKFARLPLLIGNCEPRTSSSTSTTEDIWYVGQHYVREREFIENLGHWDTIILWMYPYPNPLECHEEKFEISLAWNGKIGRGSASK